MVTKPRALTCVWFNDHITPMTPSIITCQLLWFLSKHCFHLHLVTLDPSLWCESSHWFSFVVAFVAYRSFSLKICWFLFIYFIIFLFLLRLYDPKWISFSIFPAECIFLRMTVFMSFAPIIPLFSFSFAGMMFFSFMVEDKTANGLSYVEFLVHIHRQIQTKMA